MRVGKNSKLLTTAFASFFFSEVSHATLVNYDINIALSDTQIGSNYWAYNNHIDPTTTFYDGDSIHLNVGFSGNKKLKWRNVGSSYEFASITFWASPLAQLELLSDVVFSWKAPVGDYLFADSSGTGSSSGGGFGATSMVAGDRNVTESTLFISGFSFELNSLRDRPSIAGNSGLPATFNRISLSLNGGDFSIQSIPEPPTYLAAPALLLLISISRRRERRGNRVAR